jgi:hypothetical protein
MSKRRSDLLGVARKAKRQRRHLYFVIDDGDGYAIRKLDLSSDYDSDDDAERHEDGTIETTYVVLPLPRPLLRLASSTGEFFTASGTKILLTQCDWPKRAVPAFDVRTRSLTLGPRPKKCPSCPFYIAVGQNLLSLDYGSAEFLDPPPPEHSSFDWSWQELEKAPFKHPDVTCLATHPDGRTLFVSTRANDSSATFTLDTENGVWNQYSKWALPFIGNAIFDPALDAWVGLSGDKDTLGCLCSCDVVSIASGTSSGVQPDVTCIKAGASNNVQPTVCDVVSSSADTINSPPASKLSKEKMFCEDPAEKHYGATLVYMGGRSKFCLLQCFSIIDENDLDSDDDSNPYKLDVKEEDLPHCRLLRLTTFTLKYDKNGNLSYAKRRRVRCYKLLPHADLLFDDIRAFWI